MVSSCDSSASGSWWNPLLQSNLLNIVEPDSCAKSSSVVGSGKFSRRTESFSQVRLTQILTFSFALGTTTIGAHQSVGVVTGRMTSCASRRFNSALTFSCIGRGMRQGAVTANGTASSFMEILYVFFNFLSPANIPGNSLLTSVNAGTRRMFTR